MATETSFLSYFFDAGIVVKSVMLILLGASIFSWTFIFQRYGVFKQARAALQTFEGQFWSGIDLSKLYTDLQSQSNKLQGPAAIFVGGFKEFLRLNKQGNIAPQAVLEGVQRAMRISCSREVEKLELHLSFLATVGSISPYVGLFGTVWGIMTALQALGTVQQATIAAVAPGISETLVVTAMGLFAAIPAMVAYNRYVNDMEYLIQQYEIFAEEFSNILYRQTHALTGANHRGYVNQA